MNCCEKWCNDLRRFWEHKEIENIVSLFDENVIYYEMPKEKVNSIRDIRQMWEEIKEQNTDNIELDILCINGNKCVANYILNDTTTYDMIYEIKLNDCGKCIYFKQWYMEL